MIYSPELMSGKRKYRIVRNNAGEYRLYSRLRILWIFPIWVRVKAYNLDELAGNGYHRWIFSSYDEALAAAHRHIADDAYEANIKRERTVWKSH